MPDAVHEGAGEAKIIEVNISSQKSKDNPIMPKSSKQCFGFVSPTTPGSLGDQAMLDAATTYATELGHDTKVFPHAPVLRSAIDILDGKGKFGTAAATARGIWPASHVLYIGADVLDGVYNAQSALKRLRVLQIAHYLGRRTRVLGSSWSETPAPEVIQFLKAAPWLEILARDPVSQGRMQADLDREIRLAADLAFLLRPESESPAAQKAIKWIEIQRLTDSIILAANLSGHTVKKLPGGSIEPFVNLIGKWLDYNPLHRLIVIPHDIRPGLGGDLTVCAGLSGALRERFGDRVYSPRGELNAWDAKAIAGKVDMVLTGRMHFAIAALGQGVPPVSIVYQGKFEGLMQHFGLENEGLLLAPNMVGAADSNFLAITTRLDKLRSKISSALPHVTELSRSNFDGL